MRKLTILTLSYTFSLYDVKSSLILFWCLTLSPYLRDQTISWINLRHMIFEAASFKKLHTFPIILTYNQNQHRIQHHRYIELIQIVCKVRSILVFSGQILFWLRIPLLYFMKNFFMIFLSTFIAQTQSQNLNCALFCIAV